MEKLQALKLALANMARYYGQDVAAAQIQVWAAHLEDLDLGLVAGAMSELMSDPKRTRAPLPAEIRSRISGGGSDEALAVECAGRIWDAISRRGYYWDHRTNWQQEMVQELGTLGVEVVRGSGGWQNLVTESNDAEPGIMRAQLRERAKAIADQSRRGVLGQAPALPEISRARSLSALAQILPRLSAPDMSGEPESHGPQRSATPGRGGPKR